MATKRKRQWTCRGCKAVHANTRLRKCPACKKARPAPRRAAHMKALDHPYEFYVELNGGEHCGICGKKPKKRADGTVTRRLDRDHDHRTGKPRGLLCGGRMGCNRRLGRVDDRKWLNATIAYLDRADGAL